MPPSFVAGGVADQDLVEHLIETLVKPLLHAGVLLRREDRLRLRQQLLRRHIDALVVLPSGFDPTLLLRAVELQDIGTLGLPCKHSWPADSPEQNTSSCACCSWLWAASTPAPTSVAIATKASHSPSAFRVIVIIFFFLPSHHCDGL